MNAQLERRGIVPSIVIGHDRGGTVGFLLAALRTDSVSALIVEEEIFPGIDIEIPLPRRAHYPQWHAPFNRSIGLAEALVPGREDAYYGTFLAESAGPLGLEHKVRDEYLAAYRSPDILHSSTGYYRAQVSDIRDIEQAAETKLTLPALAVGGRYGMGPGLGEGLRAAAADVSTVVLDKSGHYPAEQQPAEFARHVAEFLG